MARGRSDRRVVLALGAVGYAIRRGLASWSRVLSWALVALLVLVFGIVALFVSIPHARLIWAVAGLVIFGGLTVFDFNRPAPYWDRGFRPTRWEWGASSSTFSTL